MDAWSDGQMRSKLWLCDLIEKDFANNKDPQEIWILGSWYGLLAQLLLVRQKLNVKKIRLFDIDAEALEISKKILNFWMIENKVEIIHEQIDCNQIPTFYWQQKPNIIINTSCEHFKNYNWLVFPAGINLYVQSTNMAHPTHINGVQNLEEFKNILAKNKIKMTYADQIDFKYPNFSFQRYMISGIKN